MVAGFAKFSRNSFYLGRCLKCDWYGNFTANKRERENIYVREKGKGRREETQASWMKSYKKMVPGEQQSFRRRRREIGAK